MNYSVFRDTSNDRSFILVTKDCNNSLINRLSKMSYWGQVYQVIEFNSKHYVSFEMELDTINTAILLCQEARLSNIRIDEDYLRSMLEAEN